MMASPGSARPQFHFTVGTGWINDPHGITLRDGGYDVFYQYVPESTRWQPNCHWGHARGEDLLSLAELPVAITPDGEDDGIWTGSLVTDDQGEARAFYTSVNTPDFEIGRIRSAVPSAADWTRWRKGEIVAEAPDDLDLIAFRDPFVRREGDRWRMFVGAAGRDGTAMALTYVSDDQLTTWRYDGVALARSRDEVDPVWTGALWECPQIFAIGDRHAMVSSVWDAGSLHYTAYALGSYADGRFRADSWGRLTYGPSYYAPSLFFDRDQRPCLSFWMRGVADDQAGWAGAHSIPHQLRLEDDRLIADPHPDIDRYHRPFKINSRSAATQAIDISWNPSSGDTVEIGRGTQTVASICRTGAGTGIRVGESVWTIPPSDGLRIIIDGPVLEIAADGANFGIAIPTPIGQLTVTACGAVPEIRTLARGGAGSVSPAPSARSSARPSQSDTSAR